MLSAATLLQLGLYAASLVGGYLLRHYGVSVPLLPSPTPAPAASTSASSSDTSASGADHVGLLQRVLGIARPEAEALLQQAVRAIVAKALADAQTAVPQLATPAKS